MLPLFWPRSTTTPPTPQTNTALPAATSSLDKRSFGLHGFATNPHKVKACAKLNCPDPYHGTRSFSRPSPRLRALPASRG